MAKAHCVLLVCAVAVFGTALSDFSDAEKDAIKAIVIPMLEECGKEHGVTKEDVIAAKEAHDIDAIPSCFYRCFFKKAGLIDDQGLYAVEVAKETHKKYIKDEEILSKVDAISDACAKINDEDVTDGSEGCDRAKLLVTCLKEHKDNITPIFE